MKKWMLFVVTLAAASAALVAAEDKNAGKETPADVSRTAVGATEAFSDQVGGVLKAVNVKQETKAARARSDEQRAQAVAGIKLAEESLGLGTPAEMSAPHDANIQMARHGRGWPSRCYPGRVFSAYQDGHGSYKACCSTAIGEATNSCYQSGCSNCGQASCVQGGGYGKSCHAYVRAL